MTGVEHVTLLLNDFDDMESIRGLHDLGYYARFQGHSGIREDRPEYRFGSHSQLSSAAGAARVLGINPGQGRELLAVDDPLAEFQELLTHRQVSGITVGIDTYLTELVLDRDDRKVLLVHRIEIFLDIVWRHVRDLLHNRALLLLGEAHLLILLAPFLAEPVERLAEILFDLVFSAQVCQHPVRLLGNAVFDHVVVDGQGVYAGLHQEELGFKDLLQHLASNVPVGGIPLGAPVLNGGLDVRDQDGFVAHHRHGLVYVLVFLRRSPRAERDGGQECEYCFLYHFEYITKFSLSLASSINSCSKVVRS